MNLGQAQAERNSDIIRRPGSLLVGFLLLRVAIREVKREDLRKRTPLDWYNAELMKKPKDVGLWYAKGALLAKTGELQDAISCFDKVTDLDIDHRKGWDAKANAYYRIGEYEKSIHALDILLDMDDEDADLWFKKGEALLKLGRYVEADSCYDKAIELDPNHADAWCGKGNALKGIGKQKEGGHEEESEKPGIEARDDTEPTKQRLFENALDCFRKVISLSPEHYEAMGSKGELLCEMGKMDMGLREIDRALEGDPSLYGPLYRKARILKQLGRHNEASEAFRSLSDHSPSDVRGHDLENIYLQSIAATEVGSYQDALEGFNKMLETNPRHVNALVARGDVLAKMGNQEKALESYDNALGFAPNQGRIWLHRANTQRSLGQLDRALFSYDKATTLEPNLKEAWYQRGLLNYAVERLRESLMSFLQVLTLDPNHVGARKMKDMLGSKLTSQLESSHYTSGQALTGEEAGGLVTESGLGNSGALTEEELVHNGIRLFSQQRFPEAFECFDRASRLENADHTVWEWKGDTLVKLDRYSEAIKCYEIAVKMKHEKEDSEMSDSEKSKVSTTSVGTIAGDVPVGERLPFQPEVGDFGLRGLVPEDDGYSQLDEGDIFILESLRERPRTLHEISALCGMAPGELHPKVIRLFQSGFLERNRMVITLERGARRIVFYKADANRVRDLGLRHSR
jgi:tetratricopeptide (TPR) repeat protein